MNTGDFLIDRLKQWGVQRIYGYPGDGIDGVIGSLQKDGGIDFVQVRHEEMAAFMAVGHAKFTGELGVCLATGGPGATHLVTGLYDAKLDHMPVLAICGQAEATVRGGSYQQELNLDRLFADVAAYVQEVTHPAQLRHVVDRAIRIALAQRAPTVIILPKDVQEQAYEAPARAHGFTRSGPGYSRPVIIPRESNLKQAADLLNGGEKVAMLVGAGAIGAADEVIAVAERLGARDVPRSRQEIADYLERIRPQLLCDERSREVLRLLLNAPSPSRLARPFGGLMMKAGIDLLPDWASDMLGVSQSPLQRKLIRASVNRSVPMLRWAVRNGSVQRAKRRMGLL